MGECATVNGPLIADANADATSPARPPFSCSCGGSWSSAEADAGETAWAVGYIVSLMSPSELVLHQSHA